MNKTLIFFKIPFLTFNTIIPVSFSLVKASLKLLFEMFMDGGVLAHSLISLKKNKKTIIQKI